jgi:hypothetical protein
MPLLMSRRAKLGHAALRGYRAEKRESMANEHRDDRLCEVADCIADLLHYAHHEGFDLKSILFKAESNAGAEIAGLD